MNKDAKYLLVDVTVLPEVFLKVVDVKKMLASGEIKAVNDATRKAGISRSAFYKYRDFVFPFYDITRGKVITLFLVLEDISGILAGIINIIAESEANILTINQNIPVNGLADVTISLETDRMKSGINDMIAKIGSIKGVRRQEILSRED